MKDRGRRVPGDEGIPARVIQGIEFKEDGESLLGNLPGMGTAEDRRGMVVLVATHRQAAGIR